MVTFVGGDAKLIDLSQEDINALLEGVTRTASTPEELTEKPQAPVLGQSHQHLVLFTCGVCGMQWRVSDWHIDHRTHLYCTWCGIEQEVAK